MSYNHGIPLLPLGQQSPRPTPAGSPHYPGYNNNNNGHYPGGAAQYPSPNTNASPFSRPTYNPNNSHQNNNNNNYNSTPDIALLLSNQMANGNITSTGGQHQHQTSSPSHQSPSHYPTSSNYPQNANSRPAAYQQQQPTNPFSNNNSPRPPPTSNYPAASNYKSPLAPSPSNQTLNVSSFTSALSKPTTTYDIYSGSAGGGRGDLSKRGKIIGGEASVKLATVNDSSFPGRGDGNSKYSSMEYLKEDLLMDAHDIMKARSEHVDPEPDMCLSDEELRDYSGTAIFVYFRFLKFLCLMMGIFFILSLVNYIMYAADQKPQFKTEENLATNTTRYWYSDFFITNYSESQRDAYMATTIVALVFIVIGLVIYRQVWIGRYRFEDAVNSLSEIEADRRAKKDLTGASDEVILRYDNDGHISVMAHYRSPLNLSVRRFASFLVFCGFVAVQVFSSIAITQSSEGSQSAGGSFAIAMIAALLNITFTLLARKLTEFEKFTLMENADRSLVVKLVCFKIANIMAVYGAKRYGNEACVYDVIGEQFMSLLLVEIFFVTPSTVAIAAALTKNKQLMAKLTRGINGDDKYRARFELPVEYLAVLYKFCIAAMAMIVFPMSTVLGLLAFVVEFWGARYRLIKLCGKPIKSDANHRTVVVFMTFLIFVTVIATPFAGAAFVLSGRSMLETNTTALCNRFPNV